VTIPRGKSSRRMRAVVLGRQAARASSTRVATGHTRASVRGRAPGDGVPRPFSSAPSPHTFPKAGRAAPAKYRDKVVRVSPTRVGSF